MNRNKKGPHFPRRKPGNDAGNGTANSNPRRPLAPARPGERDDRPRKHFFQRSKERQSQATKSKLGSGSLPELGIADAEEAPELGVSSRAVTPFHRFESEVQKTEALEPTPPSVSPSELASHIQALEARLDGLIRRASVEEPSLTADLPISADAGETVGLSTSLAGAATGDPQLDGGVLDNPYFREHWGSPQLAGTLPRVDDFGLDPEVERKTRPLLEFIYKRYFRAKVHGINNIPNDGRCVIVANHSGTLPLDGAMLRTALRLEHPAQRDLRWLAEDFLFYLPFAGVMLNRIGAVRACPENAERLLAQEALISVFPEGVYGIKKLYRERYRLQRFGRGGYIRLCLRMQAPLVPCAIVGGEESSPLLFRVETFAELLGVPYVPITPTFPWFGPLGLLPAPTKWKLRFGEPIYFDNYGPEAADDALLVGRLSDQVRRTIQSLLDTSLRERKSVWFG